MAEGTIPGGAALPATLALAGALLAPIIGVIANALSRTSIQRRQQEMEYWKTRLDLIEKALSAGQSLSNALNVQIDVSNIETEYRRVLLAIREPKPPAIDTPMPFEQRAFLLRMVMLPKPAALAGWIATSTFYIFSIYFVLYILVNILVEWPPHSLIPNLVVFIARPGGHQARSREIRTRGRRLAGYKGIFHRSCRPCGNTAFQRGWKC